MGEQQVNWGGRYLKGITLGEQQVNWGGRYLKGITLYG